MKKIFFALVLLLASSGLFAQATRWYLYSDSTRVATADSVLKVYTSSTGDFYGVKIWTNEDSCSFRVGTAWDTNAKTAGRYLVMYPGVVYEFPINIPIRFISFKNGGAKPAKAAVNIVGFKRVAH